MPSALVILKSEQDLDAVGDSGVEVLTRYPHALLVSATDEQRADLARLGVETVVVPGGPVRTTGNVFDFDDAVAAEAAVPVPAEPGRTGYFLVRLVGPAAAEWLAWLDRHGAVVHDSVEANTLLVGASPETADLLGAQGWVSGVTPYRAAMGVSPGLRSGEPTLAEADLAEPGATDGGPVRVAVFPGEETTAVESAVTAAGGTVLGAGAEAVIAIVPAGAVTALAGLTEVRSVEPYVPEEPTNDRARQIMRVPEDNIVGAVKLTGTGQVVAIADSGLDTGDPATLHPDIRGRVVGITSWPTKPELARLVLDPPGHDDGPADPDSGHGTHVAGSVLGDGGAARAAGSAVVPTGIAPGAEVFFQAIGQKVAWKSPAQLAAEGLTLPESWRKRPASLWGLPSNLLPLLQQAFDAGARVHTNSWGSPAEGAYTDTSRAVDAFVWQHPDLLVLFAAGNDGADHNRDGLIDEGAVGAPGTAKNCLTVGATENARPSTSRPRPGVDKNWADLEGSATLAAAGHVSDDPDGMAAFSSRGPVQDGRIKPDVVAPGTNVLSTLSSAIPADASPLWGRLSAGHALAGSYCWSGGTSMATPLVAGLAALVRQHLVDERRHAPSAALVKAMLVNGAVAVPGQFPEEVPAGPNSVSGFGRTDLPGCLADRSGRPALFADSPADAVQTGELRLLRVRGVRADDPLRVTLMWTDAPAGSGGGLVNRLYLRVGHPGGQISDGDVVPFPLAVNNAQQVVVERPAAGDYEIAVFGSFVVLHAPGVPDGPVPRQPFAVVVTGADSLTRVQ